MERRVEEGGGRMKTNLKTLEISFVLYSPQEFAQKLLDFEAELREEQKRIQFLDKLSKVSDETFGKYLKIKEILGDDK